MESRRVSKDAIKVCFVYLPHNVSEIRFILHRENAYQLYLQFYKIAVLKVDIVDNFYVNVLVLINELRVKVPKQHNVPIHDDLTRICLVLFFVWKLWGKKMG